MFEELDLWIGELFATHLKSLAAGPTSVATPCITIGVECDTGNPPTDTCGAGPTTTCNCVSEDFSNCGGCLL